MIQLLLTLLPIVVILFMLVVFNKSTHLSGLVGLLLFCAIAVMFFSTSIEVVVRSTVAGCIRSFPTTLMIMFSILQVTVMEKCGALRRIGIFFKTVANSDKAVQVMMLNIGFGTLMVSMGATPVSTLPAILLTLGYTSFQAIALPAIGYDSLCTYALLGAPLVIFTDVANSYLAANGQPPITLVQAGSVFYYLLPVVSTLIGFCMLYIIGKWEAMRKGIVPVLLVGLTVAVVTKWTNSVENLVCITGLVAGAAIVLVQMAYLKLRGKKVFDRSYLTDEDRAYEKLYPLWKALMPWLILVALILATNLPKPVFDYLFKELAMPLKGITANGQPLPLRLWWQAYTMTFFSIVLALPFLKLNRRALAESWSSFCKRAPKPVFSSFVFFAAGEIMNMTGYSMATGKFEAASMVKVTADAASHTFGSAYGWIASYVGLLGGFITGSEASGIAMFAKFAMQTGKNLSYGVDGLIVVAAAIAFGGGLASVISPVKLQNAAAVIDRLGEENAVLKLTVVFAVILTAITSLGIIAMLWISQRYALA